MLKARVVQMEFTGRVSKAVIRLHDVEKYFIPLAKKHAALSAFCMASSIAGEYFTKSTNATLDALNVKNREILSAIKSEGLVRAKSIVASFRLDETPIALEQHDRRQGFARVTSLDELARIQSLVAQSGRMWLFAFDTHDLLSEKHEGLGAIM